MMRVLVMTDDEISAAVATEVMGWRRRTSDNWDKWDWESVEGEVRLNSGHRWSAASWTAAGQVMKQMQLLDYDGLLAVTPTGYEAAFGRGPVRHTSGAQDSGPLAVCLAALVAVRATQGN